MELPDYESLPPAPRGGRSGWGLFGSEDSLGLMNLIGPEETLAAVQVVRSGEVIPLNASLSFASPPLFGRAPLAIDLQTTAKGRAVDDVYHDFSPSASSQWDALGHVAYDLDAFYNGASLSDVLNEGRNSIGHLAQKGIATRGVVLDLESVARERDESYSPGTSFAFTVDDLERARVNAEITYRQGDIIVLRTGFLRWYRSLPSPDRERISHPRELRACGLEHTERMAEYLWNSHAAAVAADCPSLEVWPYDYSAAAFPFGALHRILLGQFGMWIGELWELDKLADRCVEIGRHEVLIASAPLNADGGVSSPANALAIL